MGEPHQSIHPGENMRRLHWPRILGLIVAPIVTWLLIIGFVYLIITLASPAYAVDAECEGATPPVLSGCDWRLPKGSSDVAFCSPQLDVDGDALAAGELSSCSISVDGAIATVPVSDPGVVITFTVSGQGGGHNVVAWCSNVAGDGEAWGAPLCFNPGAPGKPSLR